MQIKIQDLVIVLFSCNSFLLNICTTLLKSTCVIYDPKNFYINICSNVFFYCVYSGEGDRCRILNLSLRHASSRICHIVQVQYGHWRQSHSHTGVIRGVFMGRDSFECHQKNGEIVWRSFVCNSSINGRIIEGVCLSYLLHMSHETKVVATRFICPYHSDPLWGSLTCVKWPFRLHCDGHVNFLSHRLHRIWRWPSFNRNRQSIGCDATVSHG